MSSEKQGPSHDGSPSLEDAHQSLAPKRVRAAPHLSVRQIMEGKGVALGEEHDGSFHTYMAHKISKLQNCNLVDDENIVSEIFRGCFVYINGATEPPIEELRRLLIRHGGVCDNYKTSRVTHFVCNNFTDAQLKNIREKLKIKDKVIYITTAWILDSIAMKKRQSEANYSPVGLKDRHGSNIVRMFHLPGCHIPVSLSIPFHKTSAPVENIADLTLHNRVRSVMFSTGALVL